MIQLGQHVVQQQHRPFPGVLIEDVPGGQLQCQRGSAHLALGSESLGQIPVDLDGQLIPMRSRQAGVGINLRLPVPLLMIQQLPQDLLRAGQRV